MSKCFTFWQKTRRFPPALVRILARHRRGKLLTDDLISNRSGLTINEVRLLGGSLDWEVTVGAMERFLQACEIDFENRRQMQRIAAYLRKSPKWLHLRNDPEWKTRWLPTVIKITNHLSRNQ
jgi:hypothetical protein